MFVNKDYRDQMQEYMDENSCDLYLIKLKADVFCSTIQLNSELAIYEIPIDLINVVRTMEYCSTTYSKN
jgi:hypothetical protein